MKDSLIYTQTLKTTASYMDSTARLGVAHSTMMIQDNLTECLGQMEADNYAYKAKFNVFWVFTKTKVHFERLPDWCEEFTATTFPSDNTGLRTNINTCFTDKEGRLLFCGNTECCCLSFENRRPQKLANLDFPTENFPAPVFTGKFEKFNVEFTEDDFAFEQVIRSQNLDMSAHMNNTEYVKLAMNTFSSSFLKSHTPDDLELHYVSETREGKVLRFYHKQADTRHYIQATESGKLIFEMMLSFKEA